VDKLLFYGGGHHHHLALAGLAGLDHLAHPDFAGKAVLFPLAILFQQFVDGADVADIGAFGLGHGLQDHQVMVIIQVEQTDLARIGTDQGNVSSDDRHVVGPVVVELLEDFLFLLRCQPDFLILIYFFKFLAHRSFHQ
jgi:hypothetical protein